MGAAGSGHEGLRPADVRWNFLVNLADHTLFWFGFSLIAPPTILALYVSYLTTSNVLVSLIPAAAGLGWALPQLIGARHALSLRIKKWYVVRLSLLGRTAVFALAALTLLVAGSAPEVALPGTFLCVFLYRLTSGLTTPAWMDMIAKAIPANVRGRWLGLAQFLGGGLGAVALVFARGVLEAFPFPTNFGLLFLVAAVLMTVELTGMSLTREPESTEARPAPPLREYVASLPAIFRRDPDYGRYLVGRLLLLLSTLAVPFLGVYAVRRWGVEAGDVALLTAVLLASQTLGTLGWGWLLDRRGSKSVIELAGLAGALAGLVALVAPGPLWLAPAYACAGLSLGAFGVAEGNIIIEFAPPDDRPRYVGLTNTALAPFQLIAPLLGGVLADRLGYLPTFGAAVGFALAGWFVVARLVADPRRRHPTWAG